MPPFAAVTNPMQSKKPGAGIVTLNVGGQLFQTSSHTLSLAGPKCLLSTFAAGDGPSPAFIDRDPDLFAVLLSLLRTGNLPSRANAVDVQDLVSEAAYYGLQPHLLAALSNPSQFDAFNLERSILLPLNGRDYPSAVSTTAVGSVHVAHGSKITSFDCSLRRKSTVLTRFPAIDSLLALSPSLAAAGAVDSPGLHIIDLDRGLVEETVGWENQTRSISTVQAIGASPEYLFASFESGRRNSNAVVVLDVAGGFKPVAEVARQEIYGAEIDAAIPATKLEWVAGYNLLMASGSHAGPSGLLGNIRLWDIRSSAMAWELREKADCFADVTVSTDLNAVFKVGVNSGEVFMADLRKLDAVQPWVPLGGEGKRLNGKKEGAGCVIQSHGNQVFCSKGGDVELWSEVLMSSYVTREDGLGEERVFRRNMVGRVKDMGGGRIRSLGFGGNKMVLSRKDQQCVEVWQSSRS